MANDSRVTGPKNARDENRGAEREKPEVKKPAQAAAAGAEARPEPKKPARKPEPNGDEAAKAAAGPAAKDDAKPAANGGVEGSPKKPAPEPRTAAAPAAKAKPGDEKPAAPTDASADAAAEDEAEAVADAASRRFLLFAAVPSWLVSMVVHAVLLMILALITLPEKGPLEQIVAIANVSEETEEIQEFEEEEIEPVNVETFDNTAPLEIADVQPTPDDVSMPEFDDVDAAPLDINLDELGDRTAPRNNLTDMAGVMGGTGLEGRGSKARSAMVAKYGGTKGSEAAVAMALEWLAAHQERDGGWNFDHQRGPCKGRCSHAGQVAESRKGATGMALLPFLGAGQTHKEGKYKNTVERGLYFLLNNMKVRNGMADLTDSGGRLYSHGLCAIALCEAYAMTNDPQLQQPAQLALNFIVYAQDPVGGGWRYQPKQAGDTSVVGWQLMACKSGHMAYLKVPRRTILGASRFLDFVQTEGGAKYGYTLPAGRPSTTSVGLLCRMYLGWKKDEPALQRGVEYLAKIGPSASMYQNYYATQVMRHFGGEHWETWNSKMRDSLVKSQDKKGHAKGSWYFDDAPWADRGGRLYCTCMAAMILEVYYRHMPIYGEEAAEEEFPLF
jgi:hypothetical protein